jgi:hypothetical protein
MPIAPKQLPVSAARIICLVTLLVAACATDQLKTEAVKTSQVSVREWGAALLQRPVPATQDQKTNECAQLRADIARSEAMQRPTGDATWDGFVATQAGRIAEANSYIRSRMTQIGCTE